MIMLLVKLMSFLILSVIVKPQFVVSVEYQEYYDGDRSDFPALSPFSLVEIDYVEVDKFCLSLPGGGNVTIDDCCKIPVMFDPVAIDNCDKEINDTADNNDNKIDENGLCSALCLLNRTSIFVNGELNGSFANTFVTKAFENYTVWKSIIPTVINNTMYNVSMNYNSRMSRMYFFCDTKPSMWLTNLYENIMMSCPDAALNKSK